MLITTTVITNIALLLLQLLLLLLLLLFLILLLFIQVKTSITVNIGGSCFNTVINIDTSTSMIHNISTRTLCLLLLLFSFMINNTLSNIAINSNASNSIIIPSTTMILGISMIFATILSIIVNPGINRCRTAVTTITTTVNATIPSIIVNPGINSCRTAVTTITIAVVVTITTITMIAINTIMIIITSTRLLLLLLLFFL